MSIYHCSIKMVGRTGGKSAVAASAYRSGEKLYDEETGLIHDFTRKGRIVRVYTRLDTALMFKDMEDKIALFAR